MFVFFSFFSRQNSELYTTLSIQLLGNSVNKLKITLCDESLLVGYFTVCNNKPNFPADINCIKHTHTRGMMRTISVMNSPCTAVRTNPSSNVPHDPNPLTAYFTPRFLLPDIYSPFPHCTIYAFLGRSPRSSLFLKFAIFFNFDIRSPAFDHINFE